MKIRDRKILDAASRGDTQAQKELWNSWSPRILVFMQNHNDLTMQDAEDLHQEVMSKIFHSLKSYNPFYSPATWIYTIASRTLADWRRKEQRRLKAINENELEEPASESYLSRRKGDFPTPEQEFFRNVRINSIREFILSRRGRDRQLLLLVCYEELSTRKAASILGIPSSTAKDRMRKLKKELEEVLE